MRIPRYLLIVALLCNTITNADLAETVRTGIQARFPSTVTFNHTHDVSVSIEAGEIILTISLGIAGMGTGAFLTSYGSYKVCNDESKIVPALLIASGATLFYFSYNAATNKLELLKKARSTTP